MSRIQTMTCLAAALVAAGCAAGCAAGPGSGSSRGTVTGRFVMEGGPLGPGGQQPPVRSLPGTILFTGAGHQRFTVQTGRSGTFSLQLPAGRYRVVGRSPRVVEVSAGTSRQTPCSSPGSVTVTAGHISRITVACVVP